MTRTNRLGACAIVLGILMMLTPATAFSSSQKDKGTPLPEGVSQGIDYLHSMLLDSGTTVNHARLAPLLDYVAQGVPNAEELTPEKREEGTGSVYYDEFRVGFRELVEYFYNPAIPNFLIVPSVLRASGWQPGSDILTRNVKLWEEIDRLVMPLVLRGSEYEVNTPDSFGGCYYSYDLHRMLVLMKHNGHNVLLSVSKQKDESDVGRKAVIIDDKDFVYFYSGIEGLDRGLIGWMDTYMYGSFAVQVYFEKGPKTVGNALFKWLSAGWAGMNVVKRSHIYDGSRRYAEGLKGVLESGNLPPAERFAERIKQIDALSPDEVDGYIATYSRNFEQAVKDHEGMDSRSFQKIIADGGYAEVLDDKARMDTLYLEYMKHMIGKPSLVQLDLPPLPDAALAEAPAGQPAAPQAGATHAADGVAAAASQSAQAAENVAASATVSATVSGTVPGTEETVAAHALSHDGHADVTPGESHAPAADETKVQAAGPEEPAEGGKRASSGASFGHGLGGEPKTSATAGGGRAAAQASEAAQDFGTAPASRSGSAKDTDSCPGGDC